MGVRSSLCPPAATQAAESETRVTLAMDRRTVVAVMAVETQPVRLEPVHCSCGRFLLNARMVPGLWIQVKCKSCKQTTVIRIPEEE